VPCAPVNDVLAALGQAQAAAREMVVDVAHSAVGPVRQVGVPLKLSATPASIRSAPPLLGEHSDEVLAELDYGASEIADLRAEQVV
ncbi:MAG: CoA transferase, partial [Chloroflexota bacterium]|nr:CoA transferase [Chloroflexota bacterium]